MIGLIIARARKLRASRAGATAVEFVIIALPFTVLLLAVLEFGRLQWTRNAVEEVAAAGARCAGLHAISCSDNGSPRTYNATKTLSYMATKAANWKVTVANSDITIVPSTTCQGLTNFVRVTVAHQFTSGILGIAGLANYSMSSVACYPNQD